MKQRQLTASWAASGVLQRGTKMIKGLEHLSCDQSPRKPREQKRDLSNVSKYLKGGYKYRAKLFSVVSKDRTRANRHKLKHRRFHLNIKKHFFLYCESCKNWNRLPREVGESPFLEILRGIWTWSWATSPAWASWGMD